MVQKNIFKETEAEISPNFEKDINLQVEGAQKISNWIKPKKSIPRHIIIKMLMTKENEKNLESGQRKITYCLQCNNSWNDCGFLM